MNLGSEEKFEIRARCSDVLMSLSDEEQLALAKEHIEDYKDWQDPYLLLMDMEEWELAELLQVNWEEVASRNNESENIQKDIYDEWLRCAI